MTKPKVFLDLDRTLFDTDKAGEMWSVWAEHFSLIPEVCVAEREQFYIWGEGSYMHDLSAQLRAYGIDPKAAYEIIIASDLAQGSFELPYASELVEWLKEVADIAVLTYGPDDYQRTKAALCPSLAGVPVITTTGRKADVLRDAGECWLVDDKDLGANPPENVHLVQVVAPGGTVPEGKPWPICMDLKEVKEYLYDTLH